MSWNVRPLALTAEQTARLKGAARSIWNHALSEVTRGLPEADQRAVRHELQLELYRIAIEGLEEDEPPPLDQPEEPKDEWDIDTQPSFARGTPVGLPVLGIHPPQAGPWCDRCRQEIADGDPSFVVDGDKLCGVCRSKELAK